MKTKDKIMGEKAKVTSEKESKFGSDNFNSFNTTMKKIHEALEDIYDRLDELDQKIIANGGLEEL